jgi:hypothetical protein
MPVAAKTKSSISAPSVDYPQNHGQSQEEKNFRNFAGSIYLFPRRSPDRLGASTCRCPSMESTRDVNYFRLYVNGMLGF